MSERKKNNEGNNNSMAQNTKPIGMIIDIAHIPRTCALFFLLNNPLPNATIDEKQRKKTMTPKEWFTRNAKRG